MVTVIPSLVEGSRIRSIYPSGFLANTRNDTKYYILDNGHFSCACFFAGQIYLP